MSVPLDRAAKETPLEKAVREMNEKAGKVLCEQCSTPNWKVWHLPGQHAK